MVKSADTTTFAGQITGTGTLEFYAGASGITFVLSNKTATANNWTGGLIVDGVANDTSDLRILANNQLGGNNVTLIQAGTAFARLDLNGFNDTIGGLTGTGSPLNQVTDLGSAASSLTLGAGNATATFGGVIGGDTAPNSLSLVKTGSGTQTLTGANNYTGSTTVNGGDLVFNPGAFSAKTPLVTREQQRGAGCVGGRRARVEPGFKHEQRHYGGGLAIRCHHRDRHDFDGQWTHQLHYDYSRSPHRFLSRTDLRDQIQRPGWCAEFRPGRFTAFVPRHTLCRLHFQ